MDETAEQTPEQSGDAPEAEAPPSHTPTQQALQDFIDSHTATRKASYANANGSWEVDESVPCECTLCVAGRAALSA